MRFNGYKKKRNANKKWVVIYTTDSCDPIVYGMFKSEKSANEYVEYMYAHEWTEYEHNNDAHLQVEDVREVCYAYKK